MENPRLMNWAGLDLLTIESDINPLLASYIGAPYQIRGTDPAPYGRAAREYFGMSATQSLSDPVADATTSAAATATTGVWDKIKTGAAGTLLGILIVTLGVAYILWGRD